MGEHRDTGRVGATRGQAVLIGFMVSACGWLVMELEVLGTRVLTPYFGSAVYVVMGSVIGVFLLSLAIGYLLGGWLSTLDRGQVWLGALLGAAGAWLCLMPILEEPVCEGLLDRGLDEKWGSLVATLVLFGIPTTILGTVSPTAVRLLTGRAERAGIHAGVILALSTLASFAGCVVTAFYLVLLSTRWTITVSGGLLAALGLLVLAGGVRRHRAAAALGRAAGGGGTA